MIRWAPWEAQVRSRFAARERPRGFWIALWLAVAVGELLVLRPLLFARHTPIAGPTTGSAAPTTPAAPGCAASPTASRRSTAGSRSPARRAGAPP